MEELRHAVTIDIKSELVGAGRTRCLVLSLIDLAGINIERAKALGTSDDDLSGTVERDPDGRDVALSLDRPLRRLAHKLFDLVQQLGNRVVAFLEEAIGQKSIWNIVGDVFAAESDGGNLREAVAYDGQKLKP